MKNIFIYLHNSNLKLYLLSLISSLVAASTSFNFPFSIYTQHIGQTDLLLAQAQIQSITQVGPFTKTIHLGYPFGFTQWTNPEFSILQGVLIYLLQFIPNITNFGILSIVNFISIILNSLSILLIVNLISKNTLIKIFSIISGTLLPYILLSFDHPHVISFFIWNIVIYSCIKLLRSNFEYKDHVILILSLVYAPLFWINIILFTFFIMAIFYFLVFKLNNSYLIELKVVKKLFIYLSLVFISHFILFLFHKNLNGENGRTPWQSDLFSGKFTDILLSSPLIRSLLDTNSTFLNLTTMDSSQNLISLSLIFISIVAFPFIFIANYIPKLKVEEKFLILLLQLLFFEFVVGGLSNFQATLFLLFGETSPIRAWGRLIVIIPFVSIFFLISFFSTRLGTKYLNITAVVLLLTFIFDLSKIKIEDKFKDNINNLEEIKAVQFIEKSLSPCAVLQLPIDTYFIPQSAQDRGYRYYWNGKIPYILLPEFNWTSSIYVGSIGWKSQLKIPTEINNNYLSKLGDRYCAILFDSNFSQYQLDRKASLNGEKLIWPGLVLGDDVVPNYEDTRFKVILLDNY